MASSPRQADESGESTDRRPESSTRSGQDADDDGPNPLPPAIGSEALTASAVRVRWWKKTLSERPKPSRPARRSLYARQYVQCRSVTTHSPLRRVVNLPIRFLSRYRKSSSMSARQNP